MNLREMGLEKKTTSNVTRYDCRTNAGQIKRLDKKTTSLEVGDVP